MSSHPWTKEFDSALRKIDEAWKAVSQLEKKLAQRAGSRVPRNAPMPEPAWAIAITYKDDGSASVRINHNEPFALAPKLGRLLEILAADNERTGDGTIAWKPVDFVREAMAEGQQTASPLSKHALNQLVHRLRKELARLGFHAGLIQHHRSKQALRFALRPSYPILSGKGAL